MKTNSSTAFSDQLDYLKLPFIKDHHSELAGEAARQTWDHQEYLRRLVDGEFGHRQQRSIERRIKAARFPVLKTLEQYRWDWPKKINRLQIQNLFRLEFIPQKGNVIFLGTVGVGKSHLATALSFVRFSGLEELLSVAGESLVAPGNYWASGRIKKRLDWEFRFRGDLDSRRGRGGTSVHNATEPGWLVVTGGAPEQSTVHPASWRAQCRASQSSAKSSIRSMPLEMDCGPGGPSPLRPRCPPKRPSHWII